MSLASAVRSNLRYSIARPFSSICGIELATLRAERRFPIYASRRYLSNLPQRPDPEVPRSTDEILAAWGSSSGGFLDPEPEPQPKEEPQLAQDTSLPWYLQVEPPVTRQDDSHPMAERQRLPNLPVHSPPLFETLMNYVSVDLGMDYLELLDLRTLDPPPALGANLLMLVGSARSEKHLHVSADRFCRWLRSEHKLSPYADGLLGRNELKLKLRRKARRAKLMSTVGVSSTSDSDDGIRTGWVCVNVGRVEPAKDAPVPEYNQEGFVGFGKRTDGVNIVVQMFTEEKRAEIDIEGLWKTELVRSEKRRKNLEEQYELLEEPHELSVKAQLGEPYVPRSGSKMRRQIRQIQT